MANPNPNTSGIRPAKPGERRAAKPEGQHMKNRTIRFSNDEWSALKEAAEKAGCKLSDFIRTAALEKI